MTSETLVSKLWNYCNVLRDGGLPYGDYFEQREFVLRDGAGERHLAQAVIDRQTALTKDFI